MLSHPAPYFMPFALMLMLDAYFLSLLDWTLVFVLIPVNLRLGGFSGAELSESSDVAVAVAEGDAPGVCVDVCRQHDFG